MKPCSDIPPKMKNMMLVKARAKMWNNSAEKETLREVEANENNTSQLACVKTILWRCQLEFNSPYLLIIRSWGWVPSLPITFPCKKRKRKQYITTSMRHIWTYQARSLIAQLSWWQPSYQGYCSVISHNYSYTYSIFNVDSSVYIISRILV